MSSAQPADTTESSQPGAAPADQTAPLAASVTNRARWMQRVLSPWTQRWLATGAAGQTPDQAGGQHPFASLTGADAQRTLARVRTQYESHVNLEMPTTGGSLPLAGAVEKAAPAVESAMTAAPATSRRAQGPYSRPFNSVDDFIRAIEAAKERDYAPPPTETLPQSAPRRAAGPYSRPFQSMEEFVQAVNAARERDYAPPPEHLPQPAPQREAGSYTRAFTSFDDFVKAVEETRSQWGPATAEESTAEQAALPTPQPARVRPMSRIEELPTRAESRSAGRPIDLPVSPPDLSQPAEAPQPATPSQPAAQAQPNPAPAAVPQPAAPVSPAVQRSSLAAPAAVSVPEEDETPALQRSVMSEIQRLEAPTRSEPAAPTASDVATSAATLPPAPPLAQPLDMPLVQRQIVESEPAVETPVDTSEPIEFDQPIVQRQAAEVSPPATANRAQPSVPKKSPVRTEKPIVQRQVAEAHPPATVRGVTPPGSAQSGAHVATPAVSPQATEPPARPDMPFVQRHAAPEAFEPEASVAELGPIVQRQPIDNLPQPAADRAAPIVPEQTTGPVLPVPAAAPFAPPDMPLVQRHAVAEGLEPEESADDSALVVQRQIAGREPAAPELSTPAIPEAPTRQPAIPAAPEPAPPAVAQRKVTLPTPQRLEAETAPPRADRTEQSSAELPPSRSGQLPLVQRQPATSESVQPGESLAEAPVAVPPTSRAPVIPLQSQPQSDTRSAGVEMPLVQRQTSDAATASLSPDVQRQAAETTGAADEIDQAVETAQRRADVSAPPAPAARSAVPAEPVVQRQTAEAKAVPPATAPRAPQAVQSAEKMIVAPLPDVPSVPPARVEMPLVQRQSAAIENEVDALTVEESAIDDAAASEPLQRKALSSETPQRQTPTTEPAPRAALPPRQPTAPTVQRHTAEPIETAGSLKPVPGETPAMPAAPDNAYAPQAMPLVQRQPLDEPSPSPADVQRSATLDEAAAVLSQPAPDLSERILSRVAPPERRAAVKPVDLPLHRAPAQPESQPAAPVVGHAPASEGGATPFAAPSAVSFAAPAIQRMAEPVIQRTPIESVAGSADAGFIQRVETVPEAAQPSEDATEPVDLDQLARQVYPLIKRLIAIERERRAFR